MISYQAARQIIQDKAVLLGTDCVPLKEAMNRVLAKNVVSNLHLPPFTNSAMDGYVLNAADVNKKQLTCVGRIAAGDAAPTQTLALGTCMEIMTGAPVPIGGDTVIPVENTLIDGDIVQVQKSVKAHAHVRLRGEDVSKDMPLIVSGTWLTAQHISMLAATGVANVTVRRRPKVALLTTGNEVVADINQPLEDGQIYNSSLYYLQAVLPQFGAEIVHTVILKDDPNIAKKDITTALEQNPDIIISTGAVSAGRYDFIPPLIEELGGEIYFHKVFQRPGKPILVAQLKQGMWWLGLPGNPVATMVGLRFLGGTLLRGLLGLPIEEPLMAQLVSSAKSKKGFTHFLKAHTFMHNGTLCVDVLEGQASFMLNPLLKSNAWVEVLEEKERLNVKDIARVYPLLWPEIQGALLNQYQNGEEKNDNKNAA